MKKVNASLTFSVKRLYDYAKKTERLPEKQTR